MSVTFVAVDFPMAMFGWKLRPSATQSPFIQNEADIEKLTGWRALDEFTVAPGLPAHRQQKYENRLRQTPSPMRAGWRDQQLVQDIRLFAATLFGNPLARIACCASLDALVKYMAYLRANTQLTVSRLIILGHGNVNIMAIGSGREDMGRLQEAGAFAPGAEKPPRVREIAVDNSTRWAAQFGKARDCFATPDANATEAVYIYLLGCSTGKPEQKKDRPYLHAVAKAISRSIGKSVVVVGPKDDLQRDHLEAFAGGYEDMEFSIDTALADGSDPPDGVEQTLGGMTYYAAISRHS